MLQKFEDTMRQVGLWIGFVLAAAAIYGAGPFPFIEQGVRLGGAIGSAVIITLTLKPLAKEFGGDSSNKRLMLWIVDVAILIGFIFTLFNFAEVYESVEEMFEIL